MTVSLYKSTLGEGTANAACVGAGVDVIVDAGVEEEIAQADDGIPESTATLFWPHSHVFTAS